jgi:DNA repair exonuclease SbcCD ATPase subunit
MSLLRLATVVGLLAVALPVSGAAQGLGDAAARERARREKEQQTKKEAPVLTNEDLEKGRPPGAAPAAAEGASSTGVESREAPRESPPLEDRLAAERPYLDALKEAQTRLSQLESRIQELGAKLNPMSGSFIYGATGSNSANEEAEVRAQLRQAESELTEARQAVQAANQALQEFRQGRSASPAPQ